MQKLKAGVYRRRPHSHRPHAPAAALNRLSVRTARAVQGRLSGQSSIGLTALLRGLARAIRPLTTAERLLPVTVAAIVAVASLIALVPAGSRGAVGNTAGAGNTVRIAIGGRVGPYEGGDVPPPGSTDGSTSASQQDLLAYQGQIGPSFQPVTLPGDVTTQPGTELSSPPPGLVLEDGTLLTGYAPNTTVEDGSSLIQTYKVKSGDTLSGIAHKFGVSMMTLWWANNLKSKDSLHVGQVLTIPPVSGLVYTVKTGDTLASVAAKYKVKASAIVSLNRLEDTTLVVGQVLTLPGAKGAPIPTPKPTPAPVYSSGSSHPSATQIKYSGGKFHWPVIGGGNYISQYFWSGHKAIDIAAAYGSKVVAAASGKVIFAGWKSNGGGWQVWISHGGNLYTTYNHMSALTVATGQSVSRGQQVGRIGQSGWATGPHLHFEVWIGPIWNGGYQVNPLSYF